MMGTAADSVAIGKRLMREGLVSHAVRSFTRAMAETHKAEKAEAVLLRGACQLMLGNQTACLSDLDDVLERGIPALRSQALVLRACVLWRRGEFETSLQILEEVEDAGGLDTADGPLRLLDTGEVDLREGPGESKNGGHISSAVASQQVTKTGNALESMLQDFLQFLASSDLSSEDQLANESEGEYANWNVDDLWDIDTPRYRYADASDWDDSEDLEEDDMESIRSSPLRGEDLGNDDPQARFHERNFDVARLSTGLNENWFGPVDWTTILLAGGSHQSVLLEGMELFWVAKTTPGPSTADASLYDSDSDVEGTKESSFCVPLPAFYQRQGDLNSTSDGAANGFERLRNLCRLATESTEVDSRERIQVLGRNLFGEQFADDSPNLSKFFGAHVADGSKAYSSASKRRGRPRKAKKTCSTSSCNLCWAAHLWQKRFGATAPGETTEPISHAERALEALAFVLLLQVEARFSHREVPWEFDGLLCLSRALAECDEDQLVVLGPLLLNYAERLEKEVLVGSTRTFDAFVLNAAEQVERSSSLSDFGARTGILLTEELKCVEAIAERVADAWKEKRQQADLVGASSRDADEQDPWVENQQASQSPESFIRNCIKIRSDHLIAELVERLQEGDYQAVERLASEAAARRSDYCIINHVRAVCFLFQGSLRKCLRTCDDLLQRMEEVLDISDLEKYAMIQCVRELKGQCLMVTSRRNFVERAGLYLAELQRKLPKSEVEHTSAEADDSELSEATSNVGEESRHAESASASSATNVPFYCAAEQCASGNCGLNTENKWAECRCANGCHLQFHKKCWRTFVHSRQTAMCTSEGCKGRIVTPGLFMTSETMENQRSRLDQIMSNQHHATPEPVSVAEVSNARPEEACLNPHAAQKTERTAGNVHLDAARVRGNSPGRIARDTTRHSCSLCMMQLNSSAQFHKHLAGKRHQSAVATKFLDALKYRLSSRQRTSLPLSEFDDELQRLARDVRESFGSFANFAESYAAQIVVSRNERNELVVGSAPEPATDGRYFDRTAILSAEMAGQGAPLRDRSRANREGLNVEVTESEAEEGSEFDGEALGLDDEVQFPPLGEERADPTILRLRELMTVRMSADDTNDESTCDICWGEIPAGHRVAVLPCGHSDLCLTCVVNSYKRTPRNKWLCHKCRRPVEELQTEQMQRRALKVSQKRVNSERPKSSHQLRGAVL